MTAPFKSVTLSNGTQIQHNGEGDVQLQYTRMILEKPHLSIVRAPLIELQAFLDSIQPRPRHADDCLCTCEPDDTPDANTPHLFGIIGIAGAFCNLCGFDKDHEIHTGIDKTNPALQAVTK